ncbi:MAG: hypothetical protein JWN16_536 [Alphaproteobacteria bacterium]|nr:hypothetical protein [Alphaproteobacteria bacterium]
MKYCLVALALLAALPVLTIPAGARSLTSTVTESDRVEHLRPEFKIPDEPNQLFYVQRSPNANTVIYAAKLDGHGEINRADPVDAFWRKFNIDGSRQPLNFIERNIAYGAHADPSVQGKPVTFTIAALPERKLTLTLDANKKPQALMQIGTHTVKVAYVYLQVVEGGLMPDVPALDVFGTDIASGKAIHEHILKK